MADRPLNGITVADMTATFMGPYCTLLLAQYGANVVKIEPPEGDIVRHIGSRRNEGMSSIFMSANRGKRSLAVDAKTSDGLQVVNTLLRESDVFVHSMRPSAAQRLGLSSVDVSDTNDRCIYCQIHGYGLDGEYAGMPAYDDVIQAASGIAHLQGAREGDSVPRYVTTAIADKVVGMAAFQAILAALFYRERTGRGQSLDVPMLETMVSFVLMEQLEGLTFDPPEGTAGYARTMSPYRRPYRTADGYISVMVYTDDQWERFFALTGNDTNDQRFASMSSRTQNIDALYSLVDSAMVEKSTSEWLHELRSLDLPAMPVNSIDDLLNDPHLLSVGMFESVEHPTEGRLRATKFPISLSVSACGPVTPAPRLGEHSVEILEEYGYSQADIGRMVDAQVISVGSIP
jgi:crotonobetainyl-CoA:carnitine CoA-transferase CaiB-like acyl-CoA transferase